MRRLQRLDELVQQAEQTVTGLLFPLLALRAKDAARALHARRS